MSASLDFPTVDNPQNVLVNFTSNGDLFSVQFSELDDFSTNLIIMGIVYGVRIGFSALSLPVIFMVTRNKKSPIFILNMFCLFLLFVQSLLYSISLTKAYNSLSYNFTESIFIVRNDSNIVVASNVFTLLLVACTEISLTYQVWIIFESPQYKLKYICYFVTGISTILSFATTIIYFISMVYSNKTMFNSYQDMPQYLVNTPTILFVTSSCLVCAILMIKLGFAIRTRRILGLQQFNLFHIIFIMSFQTMVIPSILILISFNSFTNNEYSSQTLAALGVAFIVISMPMTTMWANSSISSSRPLSQANTFFFNSKFNSSSSDDEYDGAKSPTTLVDLDLEKVMNRNSNDVLEEEKFWKEIIMYPPGTPDDCDTKNDLDNFDSKNLRYDDEKYIKKTIETTINNR